MIVRWADATCPGGGLATGVEWVQAHHHDARRCASNPSCQIIVRVAQQVVVNHHVDRVLIVDTELLAETWTCPDGIRSMAAALLSCDKVKKVTYDACCKMEFFSLDPIVAKSVRAEE